MRKTVNERVQKFRDRMYEAGYKNMQVWVSNKPVKYSKIDSQTFLARLESIASGWTEREKTNLFRALLDIAYAHKEAKRK